MILEQESIEVCLGLDVGKTGHNAVALNRAGKKLYDRALPQDETKIRDILTRLATRVHAAYPARGGAGRRNPGGTRCSAGSTTPPGITATSEIASLAARCARLRSAGVFPAPSGDMPAVPWPLF